MHLRFLVQTLRTVDPFIRAAKKRLFPPFCVVFTLCRGRSEGDKEMSPFNPGVLCIFDAEASEILNVRY